MEIMYLIRSTDVPELYFGRRHAIRTDEPAISGSRPLNRVQEIVDVTADSVCDGSHIFLLE